MRLSRLGLLLMMSAALPLQACGAPDREDDRSGQVATQTVSTPGIFTRDQIESALPAAAPAATPVPAPATNAEGEAARPATPAPEAGLLRLQILLARAHFSPGEIDGLHGENTRLAIAEYRKVRNLGSGDAADADLVKALAAADTAPVTAEYRLTEADVAGPFSPPPGDDIAAQAQSGAHYSTARERIAERFRLSEDLLQALNPGVDFKSAGAVILVPALQDRPLAEVARIEIDKADRALRAFDASGTLLAYYPATIGSSDNPTPSGSLTVVGVAPEPNYTYDPSRLSFGKGTEKVIVPAGPNNPVGAVWIDLSRDTYGIHGTPDPSKVGKTASHGCVRLTNWDAQQLAAAVKPGVAVRFT
jgi:lipoprotein-anchoring transpeptidase ErfK/SrfK